MRTCARQGKEACSARLGAGATRARGCAAARAAARQLSQRASSVTRGSGFRQRLQAPGCRAPAHRSPHDRAAPPAAYGTLSSSMSSGDEGAGAACRRSPQPEASRLIRTINELTKWLVSGTAAGILLAHFRVLAVVWCFLGSVVNLAICKVLKRVIRQQRPSGAVKQDHGMPSSHAQSLGYLSTYAATALTGLGVFGQHNVLAALGIVVAGVFMAWLRVATGYHTVPQVLVGYALGVGTALAWERLGTQHALPLATRAPWFAPLVYALTVTGVLAFVIKQLKGAEQDLKHLKAAME